MLSRLEEGRYRLREVLQFLHVRWVRDDDLALVDPDRRSFLNANTAAEWEAISHE